MNQPDRSQPPADNPAFEQELAQVEASLQELKARYAQVQRDQAEQAQLQATRDRLQAAKQPTLQAELQQVNDRLDELAVSLESQLFSWGSLREGFWQILRFGGLGVVIGWFLAFAVLQAPQPEPQPSRSDPPSRPNP